MSPTGKQLDSAAFGRDARAAKNHPIQATNADILKRALALLWAQLPPECHVVMTIHDELVLECLVARVEETKSILQQSMVEACRAYLKTVAIETPKVPVGDHWAKE